MLNPSITTLSSSAAVVEQSFGNKRLFYMGIAILFILIYHGLDNSSSLLLISNGFKPFKVFSYGYIGVDVFLFLSGYGLSNSYSNNTLTKFYRKRFWRIIPLFVIFALIRTVIHVYLLDTSISAWDFFCNLTSLSYYQVGGFFIDWYLSALIILYIFFPLLYRLSSITFVSILVLIIPIVYYYFGKPYWTYDCLISRIPCFLAGIIVFRERKYMQISISFTIIFILFLLTAIPESRFLKATIFVPILFSQLFVFNWSLQNLKLGGVIRVVNKAGYYSLELYIANCIILEIMRDVSIPIPFDFFLYWIGTFLVTILFCLLNKQVKILSNSYL